MAEREGFEPSEGLWPSHDFQSCALDQLSHLSKQHPFDMIPKSGRFVKGKPAAFAGHLFVLPPARGRPAARGANRGVQQSVREG